MDPKVFDSHCHLHDARVTDAAAQLARARAAGVRGFLLAGVEPDGWAIQESLAAAHADVAISFGVHPQLVAEIDRAETDRMLTALDVAVSRRRPAAIGEIGLDGVGERKQSLELQEHAFRAQLAIARGRDLPVVLHVLRAQARALEIVKGDGLPRAGGVMHSYSGSADMVRDWAALGLCFSFAGPVTDEAAARVHKAAQAVPRDRLLCETDAPFQTPPQYRPAQNEPAFLVAIVAALARIRGESTDELARYTDANARRLFQL
jgi:TatD DNase family protein